MKYYRTVGIVLICAIVGLVQSVRSNADPSEQDVIAAMKRATGYMVNEISCNGGYLWTYSADLSRRWADPAASPERPWTPSRRPSTSSA